MSLCFSVERTCRLVQDDDGWIARQRPRDLEALQLPTREVPSARGDDFLVARLALDDGVMYTGIARGEHHLEVLDGAVPKPNVRVHRIRQRHDVLVDDGKRSAQTIGVDFAARDPVEANLAFPRFVQAAHQLGDGRFARTRRPHERNPGPLAQLQREILYERRLERRIPERHMVNLYLARKLRRHGAFLAFVIAAVGGMLEHVLNPFHRCAHLLDLLAEADDRVDRPHEAGQQPLEGKQHAHAELA